MKTRKALKLLFELQMKIKEFQEKTGNKYSDDLTELINLAGATKKIIIEESDDQPVLETGNSDSYLFQQILQSVSDAVYVTDMEGNFTFVCNTKDVIFGYSRDELLEKGNIECVLGENLFHAEKLQSKGEIKNIVRSVTDKKGKIHSLLINIKKVNLAGGEVLISCRDITERKKAIQALVESRVFSDKLIESMKDGFCITNATGVLLDVNSSMCRITGYSKKELLGEKPPYSYWPEEEAEQMLKLFSEKDNKNLLDLELTLKRKNGELFQAIISPARIEDPVGNTIVYFATVKDISDLRKSEKELLEKTNFLNTIIKDAAVSMWIADANGVAIETNKACLELCDLQTEEFIGKYSIIKDVNFIEAGFQDKLESVFTFGRFADITIDYKDFNEEKITMPGFANKVIRTIINPVFGIDGNVTNAIVQSVDLSEIKKVETELEKHKENLEELVKERTQELQEKNMELENFNKLFVGREFRIKELKDKIKDLEKGINN